MEVSLKSWGNSLGIRIPKGIVEDAGFRKDDRLDIEVKGKSIVISRKFRHRTLEERASDYNNELRLSDELDWGDSKGDELW